MPIPAQKRKGRSTAAVKLFFTPADGQDVRFCRTCEYVQILPCATRVLFTHIFSRKLHENDPDHYIHQYSTSSGNSTLRTHLRTHHPDTYKKLEEMEAEDVANTRIGRIFQQTLDGHVKSVAPTPKYTTNRFALACVKLVSACDLVCIPPFNYVKARLNAPLSVALFRRRTTRVP